MRRLLMMIFVFLMPSVVFAMADVARAPVYGVPTLYGEYEVTADDVRRANEMYGDAPRAQPVQVEAPIKKAAAKHPVKAKKVKKKSAKKIKAPRAAKSAEKAEVKEEVKVETPEIVPEKVEVKLDAEVPAPKVIEPVKPSAEATSIAAAAANTIDIDSFCVWRKKVYQGPLPDGLILMPGRPDLMSCTVK